MSLNEDAVLSSLPSPTGRIRITRRSTQYALFFHFGWRYFHLAGLISLATLYAYVDYLNRLFQPVHRHRESTGKP